MLWSSDVTFTKCDVLERKNMTSSGVAVCCLYTLVSVCRAETAQRRGLQEWKGINTSSYVTTHILCETSYLFLRG